MAGKIVRLRHREYEGLRFGPDNDIVFGIRGGFAPGEVEISTDHPLYEELWRIEGASLEVVDTSGPPRIYVSPIDPTREFKSKEAMLAHVRETAAGGSALARMWLEQNNIAPIAPEAPDKPTPRTRTTK